MNSERLAMFPLLLLSFSWILQITSAHSHKHFLHCLSHSTKDSNSITKLIYVPTNSSYSSILQSSIRNKRFVGESTPKPLVIVTPNKASQIQATISCSAKHGMRFRVRSGGHDYEGLSHYSNDPFVIVDLVDMRKVSVDLSDNTAWIQSGAQLGEVYYRIAEKSRTLTFPAGVCPTVGVGGHFSGGGYGMIMRKYGIAADHIIDAHLIDARGIILDRAAMGEELFWAIRGGGGNTFGVVISWRVQLVQVPPVVTVFNVKKTLEQNATKIVHRWQHAIRKFDKDLFSRIFISKTTTTTTNSSSKPTILTEFSSLFLGRAERLLPLMQQSFPELGLAKEDCTEMSWIESTLYFADFPSNTPVEALLNRSSDLSSFYFKGKSDYVKKPIPEEALEGVWERILQMEEQGSQLQFTAYGGRMDEISASSTPFPHRAGILFQIHYGAGWVDDKEAQWHLDWIRELYAYMGHYVSKNPRSAYVNYRDLDIGINSRGNYTSYKRASVWGKKYFGNNFDRLVRVKNAIDPTNFFRNEQSIPPLSSW